MANPDLKPNALQKPEPSAITSAKQRKAGKRMHAKGPTAKARAKKADADKRYADKIRAIVEDRDGLCRYGRDRRDFSDCWGIGEWAHLGDKRRFKTRGLPPEERHKTSQSAMLCTNHHDLYDSRALLITGDADVALTYEWPPMQVSRQAVP